MQKHQLNIENFQNMIKLAKAYKYQHKNQEYPGYVIQNWMRNRSTIEFLELWEQISNPNFNYLEFEAIKNDAGSNSFVMTPKKWVTEIRSIGVVTKQGRYAATYAHKDIAFEFASWISPEFKLCIITDYQRLKGDENSRLSLNWNMNREIYENQLPYPCRCHQRAFDCARVTETVTQFYICNRGGRVKCSHVWKDRKTVAA